MYNYNTKFIPTKLNLKATYHSLITKDKDNPTCLIIQSKLETN